MGYGSETVLDNEAPPADEVESTGSPASVPATDLLSPSHAELPPLPVVRLRKVELHAVTEDQCIEYILHGLDMGVGGAVVTPNLDILRRCSTELIFAALVSEAELVVADGMPLLWAARLQGTPLPQRVAGSDLITSLSLAAAGRGRSVFFLGGEAGSADDAAQILKEKAPDLIVAGTYCPPPGFEDRPTEMSRMIEALTVAKPDIVWVALGSPKQEYLINRIRQALPSAWWLGVGISFSFLSGRVQRAPRWLQVSGLEWAHRLYQEPRRLFRRYVVNGLPFAARLLIGSLYQRISGESKDRSAGHRHRGTVARRIGGGSLDESVAGMTLQTVPNAEVVRPPINQTDDVDDTVEQCSDFDAAMINTSNSERGLQNLKAIILFGGRLRQNEFTNAIKRSILDLPLGDYGSIINYWMSQSCDLARRCELNDLVVRVMFDLKAIEPTRIEDKYRSMVSVERDGATHRGTAGLVADIAEDYGDNDLILVGNATQVLLDPLPAIAAALEHKVGDFKLISHRDGTASGMMLLSCRTVRGISKTGFIDLKEQALPLIAKSHDVRVVHSREPTGLPLFTHTDYIQALQAHAYRRQNGRARTGRGDDGFSEQFAIIEPGASVASDALVHDSVVLAGATVEAGASVVRSLVCPGARVRRGQFITNQLYRGQ